MKSVIAALLLVFVLAGYAGPNCWCRPNPQTTNPRTNNQSTAGPEFNPDLNPGSPYGFHSEGQALWTPRVPSSYNGL